MGQSDRPKSPLQDRIRDAIASEGRPGTAADGARLSAIPFHQYMTLCLYHPDFGYYRSGETKVGPRGDFYTSSHVGEVMGERLAYKLAALARERFGEGRVVDVIDWGGGTGRLSRQMLDAWHSEEGPDLGGNAFFLTLVDGNPAHREEAESLLESYVRSGKARIANDAGAFPDDGGGRSPMSDRPVIVVANELLDAFPVHRLTARDGEPMEWGVGWRNGRFVPALLDEADPRLEAWLREEGVFPRENQTLEANLDGAAWAAGVASRFGHALLVFVDYGDESEELAGPHRMDGTLLCYRDHRAHNDPYSAPGEQDLTAHVNFSHVRRAVEAVGGREIWYGTQKRFLVEAGILDGLSAHALTDPFHPIVRRNRAIRQLLLSDGMSELFKVQIFEVGSRKAPAT